MHKCVIGIDFGTLSARALLVNVSDGAVLAQSVFPYPHGVMEDALPGGAPLKASWALHHPRDYLDALAYTVPDLLQKSGVDPSRVIGIGTDATGSTVMPVDRAGNPLCLDPAFEDRPHAWARIWKQQTAQDQADRVTALAAARGEPWLPNYGGIVSATWMLPKALETLEEDPELYRAAAYFVEMADWLVWQLTGTFSRSACTAAYKALWQAESGYPGREFTGALHPELKDFYQEKLAGPVTPLFSRAGLLREDMAAQLGLPAGIPVAPGILDAHVSASAAGLSRPGEMLSILGTSGCHLLLSQQEADIPGICGAAMDGILPGCLGYEAGQVCYGDHLDWLVRHFTPVAYLEEAQARGISAHELLSRKAAPLQPGQTGLMALDWWNGNRSILVDSGLRGVLIGLGLDTRAEEIYRALLEALAFGARMIVQNFERGGLPVDAVRATGGISQKNPLAMQIYADVLKLPVQVPKVQQGSAFGSAILAALAEPCCTLGYADVYTAMEHMMPKETVEYLPNPAHAAVYDTLFQEYERLHDYFGRGENPVLKKLAAIKAAAGG